MSPWHEAVTIGLYVLRVVSGAALLSVIVYRIYFTRPQRDVPISDEEIAAYKRTGRHEGGSGHTGYQLSFSGGHSRFILWLVLAAAGLLAGSIFDEHLHRHHHGQVIGLVCAALGLYCATLAGMLLHEARIARHARARRLLEAMALPAGAHILCVETEGGLLAIPAARAGYRVTLLAPGGAGLERSRINLRRAHLAHLVPIVTEPPEDHDAVLSATPFVTALPVGILQSNATGERLPRRWTDFAVAGLSLGLVRPGACWR